MVVGMRHWQATLFTLSEKEASELMKQPLFEESKKVMRDMVLGQPDGELTAEVIDQAW